MLDGRTHTSRDMYFWQSAKRFDRRGNMLERLVSSRLDLFHEFK